MCRKIQVIFINCFGGGRLCTGNIDPVTVEPCRRAAAGGNLPWEPGYDLVGRDFCIPHTEFRYIDGMCSVHLQPYLDREGLPQVYCPLTPQNNQFKTTNQTQDDIIYHVPEIPRGNPLFREIDWDPPFHPGPLDSPLFSPADITEYIHPTIESLDAALEPEHWRSADGRLVRLVRTRNDFPFNRGRSPSLPEDFEEQLDELISEYRDRYPTPKPPKQDTVVKTEELSDEPCLLRGAPPDWHAPPSSPPGWQPASPTVSSVRQSRKRVRGSSGQRSGSVDKRPKIMLRFPKFTETVRSSRSSNEEVVPGTPQQPLNLDFRMPANTARPSMTLSVQTPQAQAQAQAPAPARKTGIKLRFKLLQNSNRPIPAQGKSNKSGMLHMGKGSKSRHRAGRQASSRTSHRARLQPLAAPTTVPAPAPARTLPGPMTRSRLRQLQAGSTSTGSGRNLLQRQLVPMTRSRLRRLEAEAEAEADAGRPGNRARVIRELLETFLRHANGV